jgi:hypothetical protein
MSVLVLERVAHVAPVGVRLVDSSTGQTISDGISVRFVLPFPGRPTDAFTTPSGIFGAHGLRGLRRWELRDVGDDGTLEDVPQPSLPFRVEVRDQSGLFHSFAVDVMLPSDGLLAVPCGSPPLSPPGSPPDEGSRFLPLFSLPSRPVPPGTAAVRGRLLYESDRSPAAFAALEITPKPGADPVRGIADARGEVVVLFPYPQPAGLAGSPPAGTKQPLAKSTWNVGVRVFAPPVGSPPGVDGLPDLCTFLHQSPATLLTGSSPPTELTEATLEYGRELVLPADTPRVDLLVRP